MKKAAHRNDAAALKHLERVMGIEPLNTNPLNRKDLPFRPDWKNDTSNDTSA